MTKHLFSLILCLLSLGAFAQQDSVQNEIQVRKPLTYWQRLDSIKLADKLERIRIADSIKLVQDSLQMQWIKLPDPDRPNLFLDSLKEVYTVKNGDFFAWHSQFKKISNLTENGVPKRSRDSWVLAVIASLMLFLAIIRVSYPNEVLSMVQGFYNNRVLSQINKEDNLFNSWPFIFLYLLFGFTIGLFLYLVSKYTQLGGVTEGFNLYLVFSISILILFTLKILTIRIIGFLFDLPKLVREYVSILYLSYFNTAILFLPLVLIMALQPKTSAPIYVVIAVLLLVTIFFIQFMRAGASIFKTHSLSKFYLILYLCTLEIGPILILIKVLGF